MGAIKPCVWNFCRVREEISGRTETVREREREFFCLFFDILLSFILLIQRNIGFGVVGCLFYDDTDFSVLLLNLSQRIYLPSILFNNIHCTPFKLIRVILMLSFLLNVKG